jgi:hypothetical protein
MKIADFGLARDINNIGYYKKTTNVSLSTASHRGEERGWSGVQNVPMCKFRPGRSCGFHRPPFILFCFVPH